ncbi:MAG: nitroreductase family protein [Negativicutes bacterium]|nr:nitroreductase family protein [Negativicutes bacterium]
MDMIQVAEEKCIKCGRCAQVCPLGTLGVDEHGPKVLTQFCIACGHCVAVCPSDALDNVNTPLANQVPFRKEPVIDADTAAMFLRSRRSVRAYKKDSVPREKIRQLLDIARFAPTAGNSQGVAYHIIDDRDTLRSITAVTVDWLEEALQSPPYAGSPFEGPFAAAVANYRQNGRDIVLRNAPCLAVATADKNVPFGLGRDNTRFSLAYAELYAPSIGLGTCITGFFDACASSGYQPMLDILNLPENMCVTGALMVGYPQFKYTRLVDRNPLQITWQ